MSYEIWKQRNKKKLKECESIKNTANIITASRFCFAILMVMAIPFSALFWLGYICGGVSDMCDGWIARKLKQQSEFGAKLDSVADGVFAIAIGIVVVRELTIPTWIWSWIIIIGVIRMTSYVVGLYKFHTFSSLHTYMNKLTGFIIFIVPILYIVFDKNLVMILVCIVATLSSLEELIITIKSNELNRNHKGL